MEVYVAVLQEKQWESEPFNIGVYSTEENAEKGIEKALQELDEEHASCSIPEELRPSYYTRIETWTINKTEV